MHASMGQLGLSENIGKLAQMQTSAVAQPQCKLEKVIKTNLQRQHHLCQCSNDSQDSQRLQPTYRKNTPEREVQESQKCKTEEPKEFPSINEEVNHEIHNEAATEREKRMSTLRVTGL